jgi:hypothetical protein
MKFLKFFKQKSYEEEVAEICKKYYIRNWSINSEGLVDVDGHVDLQSEGLTKLPLRFGNVSGYFNCRENHLTSLEGGPKTVSGDFSCYENNLTSLKGCPKFVGEDFYCSQNELTSLEGCTQEVSGHFYCNENKLTSLEGGPKSVGGRFFCGKNQLTSLRFAPEEVAGEVRAIPNPISDIPKKYLTNEYLEFIVKEQPDWRLYRKDGSIYSERLKQMIEWGIETNKIKSL